MDYESLSNYIKDFNFDSPCKLCTQFIEKRKGNLFHKIYDNNFSPIIKDFESFVWGVGLGQILDGYSILIPKSHIYSLSRMDQNQWQQFDLVLNSVIDRVSKVYSKDILIFEHGSLDDIQKSGSCISHAHLHIVPIDNPQLVVNSISELYSCNSINDIKSVREFYDKPYLLFGLPTLNKYYIIEDTFNLESQFMRKLISSIYSNVNNWNWKEYIGIDEVLCTLNSLRV